MNAATDWGALLWQMAKDPDACHQLSAELDSAAAISRFVEEAPAAVRHALYDTALEIVRCGAVNEVARMRLVPFEQADQAIDALAPLLETRDVRLHALGGADRVAARLANVWRGAPRLKSVLASLVSKGERSVPLTEAVAKSVPALLASSPASFDWPTDAADAYVLIASIPPGDRGCALASLPDLGAVVAFAKRVGDPQGLLPLLGYRDL